MDRTQHSPHIDSFYHLSKEGVVGKACQGTACFVARHLNPDLWKEASSQRQRVYCLGRGGLQWPCPSEHHPGTQVLHPEGFPIGKRAALRRVAFNPTLETTCEEYPFLLTTGRSLYQFNAGTMTARAGNSELRPADFLEISPEDARRSMIEDGERVRLSSRYGETVLPARLNPLMKEGELFATFHTAEAFLNRVTTPHRDRYVKTPEYKVTAVRIEKA